METRVGGSFAGYVIEGVLGRGRMGTVNLTRHPQLPGPVVLGLVDRDLPVDPEARRRFEQEGEVVAQLDHPGIVDVYDRDATDGHLWAAAALDHAHAQGVLHLDVEPADILPAQSETGSEERAMLTDFGIARIHGSDTDLTATGMFP